MNNSTLGQTAHSEMRWAASLFSLRNIAPSEVKPYRRYRNDEHGGHSSGGSVREYARYYIGHNN